jgi:hypothetical protein
MVVVIGFWSPGDALFYGASDSGLLIEAWLNNTHLKRVLSAFTLA